MFVLVSPRWLVGSAVSLIIFLIVYFTVIRPDNYLATSALKAGEQQVQQAVHNAKASGAKVPAGVTNLTTCLAAAGSNTSELKACAAKFKK